jgi:hypothetical protein
MERHLGRTIDHDPLPSKSTHFDLADIVMSRLQTGDSNGPTAVRELCGA